MFWSSLTRALAVSGLMYLTLSTLGATAPDVTYTASGTFSQPATSGSDTLKLAGEPFTISIVANAASVPISHGPNWAVFSPFRMTGQVHSGLLGPTPVSIASAAASIYLLYGPTYDTFMTAFPVKVVGIVLTINATLTLPPGTLQNQLIHPFAPVALTPSNSLVTYSDTTGNTTTLTVSTGTVEATIPTPSSLPQAGARTGEKVRMVQAGETDFIVSRRYIVNI